MKIAFVGIPSSGKTTTAREVAKRLKATFVPEVARVLIESMGRRPTKEEQNFIMRMQSTLEKSMFGDLKVSDVPPFLNLIYYQIYHGNGERERKLYEIAKNHKYDFIFKLSPLTYINDGVRYQTEEELKVIDKIIDKKSPKFGKVVYVEPTDLEERIEFILKILGGQNGE